MITSTSVEPTLRYLSPASLPIAGIASLNYRLSSYPSHPTYPSSLDDASRNVRHPSHIQDVVTAIIWLQTKYKFGEQYVLVGHSCGATLAMQIVMGLWTEQKTSVGESTDLKMPLAVVGVEGIYDLNLLAINHKDVPMYREFIERAFGRDEEDWRKASPVSGEFKNSWQNARVVVLAWSAEDELVEGMQRSAMVQALHHHSRESRVDITIELEGKHNQIVQDGLQIANAIKRAFDFLKDESC